MSFRNENNVLLTKITRNPKKIINFVKIRKMDIKKIREEEGAVVFKAGEKLMILTESRRSRKPKGKTISGAAKMKAAYKARKKKIK